MNAASFFILFFLFSACCSDIFFCEAFHGSGGGGGALPRWKDIQNLDTPRNRNFQLNITASASNRPTTVAYTASTQNSVFRRLIDQWNESLLQLKANPLQFLSIPVIAAIVGYVTNYVGVNMLFYPIAWKGIPVKRFPGQPYGLFGWQGIVPSKRFVFAGRMVDVTITKLLKISEIFNLLSPIKMAALLSESVTKVLYNGIMPISMVKYYLQIVSKQVIMQIESLVSVKNIVVEGLSKDPATLGKFFQKVGYKELQFLVESGTYFGFALGLLQMVQWMLYPKNWTLPVGGAVVGYVTNWIALKLVFEPLNPTKFGPFTIQGMFLQRQKEVSQEFSTFIASKVLTSQEIWKALLTGDGRAKFAQIIRECVPFLTKEQVVDVTEILKAQLLKGGASNMHPIHEYTNSKIKLEKTLIERMRRLTPAEFEQVLHPIFQEDEIILIVAGGVLGALAGGLQWGVNVYFDKRRERKRLEAEDEEQLQLSQGSSSSSGFTSVVVQPAPTPVPVVVLPILHIHDSSSSRGVDVASRNPQGEDAKVALGWLSSPLTRRVVTEYKKRLVPGDKLYYDSSINSNL